jgi:hypothetical protein
MSVPVLDAFFFGELGRPGIRLRGSLWGEFTALVVSFFVVVGRVQKLEIL